jgi:hypothetical protein
MDIHSIPTCATLRSPMSRCRLAWVRSTSVCSWRYCGKRNTTALCLWS